MSANKNFEHIFKLQTITTMFHGEGIKWNHFFKESQKFIKDKWFAFGFMQHPSTFFHAWKLINLNHAYLLISTKAKRSFKLKTLCLHIYLIIPHSDWACILIALANLIRSFFFSLKFMFLFSRLGMPYKGGFRSHWCFTWTNTASLWESPSRSCSMEGNVHFLAQSLTSVSLAYNFVCAYDVIPEWWRNGRGIFQRT